MHNIKAAGVLAWLAWLKHVFTAKSTLVYNQILWFFYGWGRATLSAFPTPTMRFCYGHEVALVMCTLDTQCQVAKGKLEVDTCNTHTYGLLAGVVWIARLWQGV